MRAAFVHLRGHYVVPDIILIVAHVSQHRRRLLARVTCFVADRTLVAHTRGLKHTRTNRHTYAFRCSVRECRVRRGLNGVP